MGGASIGIQPQQRGHELRDGCAIAASLCAVVHLPSPRPCSEAKPCTQGARAEGVPPTQRPRPGQPCRVCRRLAAAALLEPRQGRGKVRRPWPLRRPPRQQRAARGLPQPCMCEARSGCWVRNAHVRTVSVEQKRRICCRWAEPQPSDSAVQIQISECLSCCGADCSARKLDWNFESQLGGCLRHTRREGRCPRMPSPLWCALRGWR